MKTTLEIPDGLFRQAKAQAALDGIKLKDFVAESLRKHLSRRTSNAIAAKSKERKRTLHDRFRRYCGILKSGIGDLSSNPKHMEGLGED